MQEEAAPATGEAAAPARLLRLAGFPFEGPGGLEGAAMRAFAAALQLQGHALEPVTDFWRAGGDSMAASLVSPVHPTNNPACIQVMPCTMNPTNVWSSVF